MRLKPSTYLVIMAAMLLALTAVSAQSSLESLKNQLRALDQQAAKAILKRDEKLIARFFTEDSITNNPRNGQTFGSKGVIEAARMGVIDYHSFERNEESVQVYGNTAILMGSETVVWRGKDGQPGETVRRRYTNVWMKQGREWRIVARHANIICP
jgi:ketosteroid isomerase-like protein